MMRLYVPVGVEAVVETVIVEMKVGVPEIGLNDTDTPGVEDVVVTATVSGVPLAKLTLIVEVLVPPPGPSVPWVGVKPSV